MITFVIQTLDWLKFGQFHYFWFFFVYVWVVWTIKVVVSRFYKEVTDEYQATVSVIIPVFREDYSLFNRVLASIKENNPHEIIVVVNGSQDGVLEAIARRYTTHTFFIPEPDKRKALEVGIRAISGELVAIVDSDTLWTKNTLSNLIKPFRDPKVGGVTTRQKILNPKSNLPRRMSAWMEEIRFSITVPAYSVFGAVSCLPGRTIAFRRSFLVKAIDGLLNEQFLGVRCVTGDDRCLTRLTLEWGLKTVYQASSVVYTDCPNTWRELTQQQLRWARSSQRETIQSLGWLWRYPYHSFILLTDMVTTFFLVGVYASFSIRAIMGLIPTSNFINLTTSQLVLTALLGLFMSITLRHSWYLKSNPGEKIALPVFALFTTVILTTIRVWGFITMTEQPWMTRR